MLNYMYIINKIKYIFNYLSNNNINNNNLTPILEPIEDYLSIYFKEFKKNIMPKYSKYKYIICFIHIIHIIFVIFFILFGIFIPAKYQIYVAFIYSIIMLTWIIYGRCILIILTNYLGDTDIDYLFPFKWTTMYITCISLIFISLLFYIFPILSPFNFLLFLNNR